MMHVSTAIGCERDRASAQPVRRRMHRFGSHGYVCGCAGLIAMMQMSSAFAGPLDDVPAPPQFIADRPSGSASYLSRIPSEEIVYFLMPDRFANGSSSNDNGGIAGTSRLNGYYPQHAEFFHGGDFSGIAAKLDYIQGLGVTALWLGPVMANRAVQGDPGKQSGGYHGRWVIDFTRPDPHFGNSADFAKLVNLAHSRGMKVYMDVIVNGTADLIRYRQCHDKEYVGIFAGAGCPYRSKEYFPYTTMGGIKGNPINQGFAGDSKPYRIVENFSRMTSMDYAYLPYFDVPQSGEKIALSPPWLNDIRLYHNRGNAGQSAQSHLFGDLPGQDDLFTENPRVLRGLVTIYTSWLDRYKIDGLRIVGVENVDEGFIADFSSAIASHARSLGIGNFVLFAAPEASRPGEQAAFMQQNGLTMVTDQAFAETLFSVLVGRENVGAFKTLFKQDTLYGVHSPAQFPLLLSSHWAGRLAGRLRASLPLSEKKMLETIQLAYGASMFLRGVPVIYFGDEQGFASDESGPSSMEDMFPSLVASYNDNDLVGSQQTTREANFNESHPLYRAIAAMAAVRSEHATLRDGTQILRHAEDDVLAISRFGKGGDEYLLAYNFGDQKRALNIEVGSNTQRFKSVVGQCKPSVQAAGSYPVDIPPRQLVICQGTGR